MVDSYLLLLLLMILLLLVMVVTMILTVLMPLIMLIMLIVPMSLLMITLTMLQVLIQCGIAGLVVLGPLVFSPSVVNVRANGTSHGTLFIFFTCLLLLSLVLQFLCVRACVRTCVRAYDRMCVLRWRWVLRHPSRSRSLLRTGQLTRAFDRPPSHNAMHTYVRADDALICARVLCL